MNQKFPIMTSLSDFVFTAPVSNLDINFSFRRSKFLSFDIKGHKFNVINIMFNQTKDKSVIISCDPARSQHDLYLDIDVKDFANKNWSFIQLLESISNNTLIHSCEFDFYDYSMKILSMKILIEKNQTIKNMFIDDSGVYFHESYHNNFFDFCYKEISVSEAKNVAKMTAKQYLSETKLIIKVTSADVYLGDYHSWYGNDTTLFGNLHIMKDPKKRVIRYCRSDREKSIFNEVLEVYLSQKLISNNQWNFEIQNCEEVIGNTLKEFFKIQRQNDLIIG